MTEEQMPDLTRNQSLVLDVLTKSDGPMSAYTILDELRDDGFRAPLQVYRALDKLVEQGRAHRLESLNSFVACRHTHCSTHEAIIFMICDSCNQVAELSSCAVSLGEFAQSHDFKLRKSTVELFGNCTNCKSSN